MPASHTGIVDGTELYGPICFQSGRFRRAALLPEVPSRSCRALVRGGDGQPWFGDTADGTDAALTLGSPGLNDATWHVLQACVPHRRILPAGCEAVMFSGWEADGAVEIRAAEIRAGDNRAAEIRVKSLRGAVPEPRPAAPARPRPPAPVVPRHADGAATARPAPKTGEYVWGVEAVAAAGRAPGPRQGRGPAEARAAAPHRRRPRRRP